MSEQKLKYWFPAKRYGWGWGPPVTWQGWAVLVVWIAAVIVASIVTLGSAQRWELFAWAMVILVVAIVVVCWITGEPPRWRWGKD